MPSTSTNYGLALYNSTTDGAETFLDFRSALAGTSLSSNMNLVDLAMKDIQDQVDELAGRKGIVSVSAKYVSSNYYEASIPDITVYESGQIIALKLDTTSDGTVTLNINSLGTKSVMKVDSSGAYVNITGSDLRINREYNFKYDGTRWIWMDATSSDQINVEGTVGNLLKISSSNTVEDSGSSPSDFAPASEGVTNGDSHDHISGDGNPITEGSFSFTDITTGNSTASQHGLLPKLSGQGSDVFAGDGTWKNIQKDFNIEVVIGNGIDEITTSTPMPVVEAPQNGTIAGWTIVGDASGSIVVDVWKDTFENFPPTVADTIAGSEKPTLSSEQTAQDLTLTTWTTTVTKGDWLKFNIDSADTVKLVTLSIRCEAS